MDRFALQAGNRLVGNPIDAAALEITAGGASFEILKSTVIAVAGGGLEATLNDIPLSLWMSVWAHAGSILRFGTRRSDWGARTYLALAGGIDVPEVLDSRSTYLPATFGGFQGRALRPSDLIPTGPSLATPFNAGLRWPANARPRYANTPTLRLLPGPHLDRFPGDALDRLQSVALQIDAQSNRIGYRLEGVRLESYVPDLPSLPVFPGVIQVPPDGTPILLMADAQPTGGYPVVAVVIAADVPLAAQLLPGDRLGIKCVDQHEAIAAWHEMQQWLATDLLDHDRVLLEWAGG